MIKSTRATYAHAWRDGYDIFDTWGRLGVLLRPFWRGQRYLTAWDNGFERARTETILRRIRAVLQQRRRAC